MSAADRQVYDLLPMLATDLPGCGKADKLHALERAAETFCQRSRCWREVITVTLAEDAYEVSLIWPNDGYAISVMLVSVDGARVRGSGGYALLPCRAEDGRQGLAFRNPPMGGAGCDLEVFGTLVPRAGGAFELPEWVLDRFGAAIADGAIAMLKRHGRKAYSDPEGSLGYQRTFERGVADAAVVGAQRMQGVWPWL